jgi:RNA polymerase sigma-70 factor (ECF subfamily)
MDQSALAALYDESSSIVYGLILRVLGSPADAEEVTIDVYTQVWKSACSYQGDRGTVLAWLATIARTRAIDRLRSRVFRASGDQPLAPERAIATTGSEDDMVRRLDAKRVNEAFRQLSQEQREAVTLAYFSGMSHSEIAERLNLPIGTVKTRIRLAMLKLREVLGAAA